MMRNLACYSALLVAALGCTNAGADNTLPPLAQGAIGVGVYLDRDATHTLDTGDTTFAGVRIALLLPGGNDTLRIATTDSAGLVAFDSLPIGTYRVAVDRHALGDSIGVVAGDTGTIRLTANPDSLDGSRTIRLGYTEVSIAQARALAPGRRVIVHGHVLSPLQAFRDTSAFLGDTSGNIRIVDAVPQHGATGNNPGDSVLVLGTSGTVNGEPVLIGGRFTLIVPGLAPVPQTVSVADARTASGGTLDAALVQLNNVVITDTMAAAPDFVITVADPSDTTTTLTVVLDELLNAPHGAFPPGRTATLRGVLIPVGDGTWLLKPRSATDVVLN